MAQNVAPGIYTKIIDLSEYVRSVPSTIGFVPIICEQGPDNQLIFTNSQDAFLDFGEPDISYTGNKYFGQGPYIMESFLKESDSLYLIRCLPTDAAFANLIINADPTGGFGIDGTCSVTVSSEADLQTEASLNTEITTTTSCVLFYGVGRGDFYNNFRVKISKHPNPQLSDPTITGSNDIVYILDIYRKQEELDEEGSPAYEIISSYNVSFNPKRYDSDGESMYIEDVVNRFSTVIKCMANAANCVTAIANGADFSQPFADPLPNDDVDEGHQGLDNGSTGSLFVDGIIDTTVAEQILSQAYSGTLPSTKVNGAGERIPVYEVLDTDNIYFTIILDGGYTNNVKTSIETLVQTRKDCIAIIDNQDNVTPQEAIDMRQNTNTFNTKYMALYEPYSRVYDKYTGRDLWLSPVYHLANIIPYTDNVSEVWYAPAGFNRATIASIKELRFSPLLGDRNRFYLEQINPIVKFNVGYTVYSQLTTQKRPTALQDVNIIRLVLFIKRAIEQFCKFYVFEMNDSETWSAISQEINKFLKQIQNRRGLYGYSVEVGANDYEIKAKQVHVNITLNPTRVVEQIYLNFFIK